MNDRSRNGFIALAGIGLVVLGIWMLFERIVVPFVQPLGYVLHGLSQVGWPLLLVAAGVLILARRRPASYTGSLHRSRSSRMIGGVLGGIATRLGFDPMVARVAFMVLALVVGVWPALVFYAVALFAIPEEPAAWATVSDVPAPPAPPVG